MSTKEETAETNGESSNQQKNLQPSNRMAKGIKLVIFNAKKRLLAHIKEIQNLLKTDPKANPDTYLAKARTLQLQTSRAITLLSEQNDKWLQFIQTASIQGDDRKDEVEKDYDNYTSGDDNFIAVMDLGREALDLLEAEIMINTKNDQNETSITNSTLSEASHPLTNRAGLERLQLPKMRLPNFSGDAMSWPSFWQSFESSIHNAPIASIQKMAYLTECLKGNALNTIRGLAITNENYKQAIEMLRTRYGDEQVIAKALHAELFNMPKANESLGSLRSTMEAIERVCRQLSAMKQAEDSPLVASAIESKFPPSVLSELIKMERAERQKDDGDWNTKALRDGLTEIIATREQVLQRTQGSNFDQNRVDNQRGFNRQNNFKRNNRSPTEVGRAFPITQTNGKQRRAPKCFLCDMDNHTPFQCRKVIKTEDRINKLTQQERCFICLRRGHVASDCRSDMKCRNCHGRHNNLICRKPVEHRNKSDNKRPPNRQQNQNRVRRDTNRGTERVSANPVTTTVVSTISNLRKPSEVLLMAKKLTVKSKGNEEAKALVFFDCGSQMSFITNKLAKKLSLPKISNGKVEVTAFQGTNPIRFNSSKYAIQLLLESGDIQELILNGTEKITSGFHTASMSRDKFNRREFADIGNITTMPSGEPEILIGMGEFWQFLKRVERVGKNLYIIHTTVGPMLCGRTQLKSSNYIERATSLVAIGASNEEYMPDESQVENFWSLQGIGICDNPHEKDDEIAIKLFNESIQMRNGRYSVKWPWKDKAADLPTNYQLSYCRLKSALRKLQSSPDLLQKYDQILKEQLELGIIEIAPPSRGELEHYLPHQPVVRLDKASTKLRIVYDASAKLKDKPSLNECLYRGPVLLPDLAGLLLRFRLPKIVLLADIEKAFLQIELEPEDRNVTKLLWLKDTTKPLAQENLIVYRFARVGFGVISSPFLLAATIQHHLKKFDSELAEELATSTYVDNLMMTAENSQEAIEKYRKSKEIFAAAKMNLREYMSNSVNVMNVIPKEDRLDKENPKMLGIPWDVDRDVLTIIIMPKQKTTNVLSRRIVLQELASTFDPLGLTAPVMLKGKLFFQTLWDKDHSWDSTLTEPEMKSWKEIKQEIAGRKLSIPRYIGSGTNHQLHVFVDASQEAYAAAVYLRNERETKTEVNLIFSKNRLKPSKGMTIPRLELMALVIGTRAIAFVKNQLKESISKQFVWGDSQCALQWISSNDHQPRFVANRLREIRKSNDCSFRYIHTSENPADLSTRGCTAEELLENRIWWHGPEWLSESEENWPSTMEVFPPANPPEDDDGGKIVLTIPSAKVLQEPPFNENRFSSLNRLLRTTIYALRFIKTKLRKQAGKNAIWSEVSSAGPFSAKDFEIAERYLLRQHQQEYLPATKEMANMKLAYGEDGILRIQTRLHNSELAADTKSPIYLSKDGHLTSLIILELHQQGQHNGVDATLTKFLSRFWCMHARKTVKKVLKQCMQCRQVRAKPYSLPQMPPLPKTRVIESTPFNSIGLDYLGPTVIRQEGNLKKVWIMIITCFTTRAVYLDVMMDLSTTTFINAFRRFVARRGRPEHILSDNATQFKAAAKVIETVWEETLSQPEVAELFASQRIKWDFIPELGPWHGGLYERLVALVKDAFKKSIGKRILTLDQISTFVTEVEATMNNRPITYVSTEADGMLPLRPIDFLHPKAELTMPGTLGGNDVYTGPEASNTRNIVIEQWKSTNTYLERFWTLWKREYLLALRARNQQHHKGPKSQNTTIPKVGEVVLIEDENRPRNLWKLARIVELETKGEVVRVAKVKLANGHILRRPISGLYSLEVTEDETSTEAKPGDSTQTKVQTTEPASKAGLTITEEAPKEQRYNFRKRKVQTFTHLISLLALLALVTQGASEAPKFPHIRQCLGCRAQCMKRGIAVSLSQDIDKIEVCCANEPCEPYTYQQHRYIELPKELLVRNLACDINMWTKNAPVERSLHLRCPAQDECELIDCYFCQERFGNPDCRSDITIVLMGLGIVILILVLCCATSLLRQVCQNTKWWLHGLCCCPAASIKAVLKRKNKKRTRFADELEKILEEEDEEVEPTYRNRGFSKFQTLKKNFKTARGRMMTLMVIIFAATVPTTEASCAEVVSLTAKEELCKRSTNGTECAINDVVQLTILPAAQTNCLLIRDAQDVLLGTLKFSISAVTIDCMPTSLQMTRSYEIKVEASHRCPRMGSCYNDYCHTVNTTTMIDELATVNHFPGNAYCTESDCTMWCGCIAPSTPCLFYRVYASPTSDTVFEVYRCPIWEHRIKLTLRVDTDQEAERTTLILVPGMTTHWKELYFTPTAISQAPAPVLGHHFITDGRRVAISEQVHTELKCADELNARNFSCALDTDACSDCQHVEEKVNCQCRHRRLEDYLENPNLRLPLKMAGYELRNHGREVFVNAHGTPVTMRIKMEGFKLATVADQSLCTFEPVDLIGCYRCEAGATLNFKCSTDYGQTLAKVNCSDGTIFTSKCSATKKSYTTNLMFNHARVDASCEAECPRGTTTFKLQGRLRYVPQRVKHGMNTRNDEDSSKPSDSMRCFLNICIDFDGFDLLAFVLSFVNFVPIFGIAAIGILLILTLWRISPLRRLQRASSRVYQLLVLLMITCHTPQSTDGTVYSSRYSDLFMADKQTNPATPTFAHYIRNADPAKTPSFNLSNPVADMDPIPLMDFLAEKFNTESAEQLDRYLTTLEARLRVPIIVRKVTLKTVHLKENKTIKCDGLSLLGSNGLLAYNGLGNISVEQHYRWKHGVQIEHLNRPCIIMNGGGEHKSYFPIEILTVIKPPEVENDNEGRPYSPTDSMRALSPTNSTHSDRLFFYRTTPEPDDDEPIDPTLRHVDSPMSLDSDSWNLQNTYLEGSTANAQQPTTNVQRSPSNEQRSPSNAQSSPLNVQHSSSNGQRPPPNVQRSPLNVQHPHANDICSPTSERRSRQNVQRSPSRTRRSSSNVRNPFRGDHNYDDRRARNVRRSPSARRENSRSGVRFSGPPPRNNRRPPSTSPYRLPPRLGEPRYHFPRTSPPNDRHPIPLEAVQRFKVEFAEQTGLDFISIESNSRMRIGTDVVLKPGYAKLTLLLHLVAFLFVTTVAAAPLHIDPLLIKAVNNQNSTWTMNHTFGMHDRVTRGLYKASKIDGGISYETMPPVKYPCCFCSYEGKTARGRSGHLKAHRNEPDFDEKVVAAGMASNRAETRLRRAARIQARERARQNDPARQPVLIAPMPPPINVGVQLPAPPNHAHSIQNIISTADLIPQPAPINSVTPMTHSAFPLNLIPPPPILPTTENGATTDQATADQPNASAFSPVNEMPPPPPPYQPANTGFTCFAIVSGPPLRIVPILFLIILATEKLIHAQTPPASIDYIKHDENAPISKCIEFCFPIMASNTTTTPPAPKNNNNITCTMCGRVGHTKRWIGCPSNPNYKKNLIPPPNTPQDEAAISVVKLRDQMATLQRQLIEAEEKAQQPQQQQPQFQQQANVAVDERQQHEKEAERKRRKERRQQRAEKKASEEAQQQLERKKRKEAEENIRAIKRDAANREQHAPTKKAKPPAQLVYPASDDDANDEPNDNANDEPNSVHVSSDSDDDDSPAPHPPGGHLPTKKAPRRGDTPTVAEMEDYIAGVDAVLHEEAWKRDLQSLIIEWKYHSLKAEEAVNRILVKFKIFAE